MWGNLALNSVSLLAHLRGFVQLREPTSKPYVQHSVGQWIVPGNLVRLSGSETLAPWFSPETVCVSLFSTRNHGRDCWPVPKFKVKLPFLCSLLHSARWDTTHSSVLGWTATISHQEDASDAFPQANRRETISLLSFPLSGCVKSQLMLALTDISPPLIKRVSL